MASIVQISVLATLQILLSCGQAESASSHFLTQPLAATKSKPSTIWQNASSSIDYVGDQDAYRDQILVLVRADGDEAMQTFLDRQLILATTPGEGLIASQHLVALQSELAVAELAHLAHDQPGSMCSPIRRVSLRPRISLLQQATRASSPYFEEVVALDAVIELVEDVSEDSIVANIVQFENATTRHHLRNPDFSPTLKALVEEAAGSWPLTADLVSHQSTDQNSIIATLPGEIDSEETIVIGAHLDSINPSTNSQQAPGADDNASGMAVLLELIRVFAASNATFARTIEFHFYAAEEVGLVGSNEIAQQYAEAGRNILAMLNLDMNAYSRDRSSKTVYLPTDYTSFDLRQSVRMLMATYLASDVAVGTIGSGGTSDHESWNEYFPAVFMFEDPSSFNPNLHTSRDTSAELAQTGNTTLSAQVAKAALAFLAHHAGYLSANADYESQQPATIASLSTDLRLAILPAGSVANQFQIAIASSVDTAEAALCPIAAQDSRSCLEDYSRSVLVGSKAERRFFEATQEQTVQAGEWWRVMGWNESGQLTSQRSVRFENPQ